MHEPDTFGVRTIYGTHEINSLSAGLKTESASITRTIDWTDPDLARIERLRLLRILGSRSGM
jgi:hypothetical protein